MLCVLYLLYLCLSISFEPQCLLSTPIVRLLPLARTTFWSHMGCEKIDNIGISIN